MEYPAKYDFFLNFKALFNKKDEFIDYILVDTSDNLKHIIKKKPENLLGKKLSELFIENDNDFIGAKEFYYHMVPNTTRKFEKYVDELNRWYFINITSDEKEYLKLFYTDITKLKEEIKKSIESRQATDALVINLQDSVNLYCYIDKLTGLYNKDFFQVELSRLDTDRQLPISIIIGDLNGLKLINDAFGHYMGDQALMTIANAMKKVFRKEDIVVRLGGDEFVALLPNTTEETSLSIIERIKIELSHNPLDFLQLSMSFGTSTKTNIKENIIDLIRKAEEKMYFNKLKESKEAKQKMIRYLRDTLTEISFETKQHHQNLERLSLMLADKLALSQIEKREIKLLCEFHDIGKAGIPNYILHKEEPLNSEEWGQIRRHSEIGYHIMKSAGETVAIDELVLMHHERWDGKGYPGILKGEEIPKVVRIFAIADAYEAMVNDRPYKERMTHQEALNEIQDKAGTQFDPELAMLFMELMELTGFNAG